MFSNEHFFDVLLKVLFTSTVDSLSEVGGGLSVVLSIISVAWLFISCNRVL